MHNSSHGYPAVDARYAMRDAAMIQALTAAHIMMGASIMMCLLLFIQLGRPNQLTSKSSSANDTSASSSESNAD
jgi:hypothetical protein